MCCKNIRITIFTPTYNRAYILDRAYQSLVKQDYENFEWVIMDDGSTDGTKELVEKWVAEGKINIIYEWQENQGRFAAFNNAQHLWTGELMYPLDSDDYMLEGALTKVATAWAGLGDKRSSLAGIVGYTETNGGKMLGTPFPDWMVTGKPYEMSDRYNVVGDKPAIMRVDLLKQFKYPIYKGERFGGDCILYNQVYELYPAYLLREKLSFREYLADSITNNLLKNHILSKNGMREHYRDFLAHESYNKYNVFKHAIGYIAYSRITGISIVGIQERSPKKFVTLILYPAGVMFALHLKFKAKQMNIAI